MAYLPTERIMMYNNNNKSNMTDRLCPGLTTTVLSIVLSQVGSGKIATGDLTNKPKTNDIQLASSITTIGTWNVRTLSRCGKLEELSRELDSYRWDVIGLSEIRWIGTGEETIYNRHKFLYSEKEKLIRHGVGFLIRKELINSILNYNMISSRIISVQISAKPMFITIIQVYAPTSEYSDEEIEVFYELIEETISSTPKKDFLVILDDWNAKAGADAHIT